MTDLCQRCHDEAPERPGGDLCRWCALERLERIAELHRRAAALTAENEARIVDAEETAA